MSSAPNSQRRAKVVRLPAVGRALTDLGNAERFVAQHGQHVRYCYPFKSWLTFTGSRWEVDASGHIERLAKETVRSIYAEAAAESEDSLRAAIGKHARGSESGGKLHAMLDLARSDVPVLPSELDADPLLFNVANGTIDLRTGDLRPHSPLDLITKQSPVTYDPHARHAVWDAFVEHVTGGDIAFATFLRQVAGYCLTGLNQEKRFFLAFGEPDTGKSTFLDALRVALGDYARVAAPETWLLQSAVGGNRGDLARLVGARLVLSSEFRSNARFDEALIKSITGGDAITCAAKYQAEFTFQPQFKILLAANDAPRFSASDEGMAERGTRLPFSNRLAEGKKDPKVKQALCSPEDAGAAVLAWMVTGCLEWQQQGLTLPEVVKRSSAEYRDENDNAKGFFDDELVFTEGARTTRKEMRLAYEQWCEHEGVRFPLGPKEFAARLRARGASDVKVQGSRLWTNVRRRGEWEGLPNVV